MSIAQLRLKQGVPAAPADPNSAEQGIIKHINLMSPEGTDGFRLDTSQNWTPQRAQWKNGGVWVESAINDGRQLLAAARGNVLETIPLILVAESQNSINFYMRELGRFAQAVTDFQEGRDREPPYIELEGVDAPGAQYAPVAMVNIADRNLAYAEVGQKPCVGVTLTIEREAGWRMLWPGGNPIECHFQLQGKTRGSTVPGEGYTYSDMAIQSGSDHFKVLSAQNRTELGLTANKTFLTGNWLDIDDIPGDMPALCCMAFQNSHAENGTQRLLVAHTLNPTGMESREALSPFAVGDTLPAFATLNFADEQAGVMTKANDACGVIGNNSNTQEVIETYTHPAGISAVFARRAQWALSSQPLKTMNLWRGTWMAFMRCKATNGSANDIRARLLIRSGSYAAIALDEVGIPVRTPGASCINEWALVYMGQFRVPFDKNAFSSVDGRGIFAGSANLEFEMQSRNTTASTRALEFLDIVFLPIEVACVQFERTTDEFADDQLNVVNIVMDNTGYLAHGQPGEFCIANSGDTAYDNPQELSGRIPQLLPVVNNRLYILMSIWSTALELEYSAPEDSTQLRLNIVPRWSGIRDV